MLLERRGILPIRRAHGLSQHRILPPVHVCIVQKPRRRASQDRLALRCTRLSVCSIPCIPKYFILAEFMHFIYKRKFSLFFATTKVSAACYHTDSCRGIDETFGIMYAIRHPNVTVLADFSRMVSNGKYLFSPIQFLAGRCCRALCRQFHVHLQPWHNALSFLVSSKADTWRKG